MGLAMGKDMTGDLNLKDVKINNKDIAAQLDKVTSQSQANVD